jgi:hypothetical protein
MLPEGRLWLVGECFGGFSRQTKIFHFQIWLNREIHLKANFKAWFGGFPNLGLDSLRIHFRFISDLLLIYFRFTWDSLRIHFGLTMDSESISSRGKEEFNVFSMCIQCEFKI